MTTLTRQPKGIPAGGQFAPDSHAEPGVALAPKTQEAGPQISVPSDPRWYRLVYEDRPSNGERRSYARAALAESLGGDDFNAVHDENTQAGIRDEAARDDSMDKATDRVAGSSIGPHQFGAAVARELKTIRGHRLAVESHYVPTADATFEVAAAEIGASPQEYRNTLEQVFPHVPGGWFDQMMTNQQFQPESWQRRELHKLAVANECGAALKATRPEVTAVENPEFTSHPVTPLESRIDALIIAGGNPVEEGNIRYLANEEGAGYGTVHIREFARQRMQARRGTDTAPGKASN